MPFNFLSGGGTMGRAIRAFAWDESPLGRPEDWPPVLKTSVALILGSQFPQCLVWGPELTTLYNDAFRPILGAKPEALGRPFSEVWAEVWPEIGPLVETAFAGEATFIEDHHLIVDRSGRPEDAWFTFCYSPVRDEDGNVLGMLDTVVETTGKVQAEQQARLLNHELAHRMKNMLAVVQAIANQIGRSGLSAEEAQLSFGRRLAALGRAHDLLTQDEWSTAPIGEIVEQALGPHVGEGRGVTISGPPVALAGRQALSLALAVHELATNAVKYGALSNGDGHIDIAWESGDPGADGSFVFRWTESGGPPAAPPGRNGFGTRLITRILPADFGGTVELDYAPTGLRCALHAPMRAIDPERADANG
jgi:two-component sensor histidine kinase